VILDNSELCEGDPDYKEDGYDDAPAVVSVEVSVRFDFCPLCKEVDVIRQVKKARLNMTYDFSDNFVLLLQPLTLLVRLWLLLRQAEAYKEE
jgi:hypothetical protein